MMNSCTSALNDYLLHPPQKFFSLLHLVSSDEPSERYCVPPIVTAWVPIDAARTSPCSPSMHSVTAREAFGRSMPRPLLWRSFQLLRDSDLRDVFAKLGLRNSQPSLAAAALGSVSARPLEMHRAILAITLALAGKNAAAKTPTIIESVTLQNQDGTTSETNMQSTPVLPGAYEQVLTPKVIRYARGVLTAPIQMGTLKELSSIPYDQNRISLIWAKTGTFAHGLRTQHIWIVGGLVVDGEPYSWLVLAGEPLTSDYSFGNANANAFAPFAKLLIEAAVRDRESQSKNDSAQRKSYLDLK